MKQLSVLIAGASIAAAALLAAPNEASAQQWFNMMLQKFSQRVDAMTAGRLKVEVLPDGAVVGAFEILDAVDKGLVESGFAWTHYWSGKHPAAMLFGSPSGGSGLGMDQMAWVSWFLEGGGKE